jgi:transposase-like protein
MVKSRQVFTREFKLAAIKELDSGKPLGLVARQLEVSANTLHRWRREFSPVGRIGLLLLTKPPPTRSF